MTVMPPPSPAMMLDTLCPMHLVLSQTGHIMHAGPTLRKILKGQPLSGGRFLELVELKRPRTGMCMADLLKAAGKPLHLQLRHPPRTELKGVLVPLPERSCLGPPGGAVVNLSFGIAVIDAVRDFDLTNADFAATDLTIEMLYLVEAKSAAMAASRSLNQRLQGAKIAAEEQAFTDTLTGLKNRRAMEHLLQRYRQTGADFVLMQVDLDYFKSINDTYGHAAGDHVLQVAAQAMVAQTRPDDAVIRAGGDEFVILLAGAMSPQGVTDLGKRVIAQLDVPISFQGGSLRISGSIGAVLSAQYEQPLPERMMEDADLALYAAKAAGRGQVMLYSATMRLTS